MPWRQPATASPHPPMAATPVRAPMDSGNAPRSPAWMHPPINAYRARAKSLTMAATTAAASTMGSGSVRRRPVSRSPAAPEAVTPARTRSIAPIPRAHTAVPPTRKPFANHDPWFAIFCTRPFAVATAKRTATIARQPLPEPASTPRANVNPAEAETQTFNKPGIGLVFAASVVRTCRPTQTLLSQGPKPLPLAGDQSADVRPKPAAIVCRY